MHVHTLPSGVALLLPQPFFDDPGPNIKYGWWTIEWKGRPLMNWLDNEVRHSQRDLTKSDSGQLWFFNLRRL